MEGSNVSGRRNLPVHPPVPALRKGRNQSPCEVKLGLNDEREIILRTVDRSGVSPIVAVIDRKDALRLARALIEASEKAEALTTERARKTPGHSISG